jgi:protein tyrosine/serine phosphatase
MGVSIAGSIMLDRCTKFSRFQRVLLPILVFLAFANASFAGDRGLPRQQGILNFGKIDERLYRGAEPDSAALANLQQLGIKTIIDLRMPKKVWKAEGSEARTHGILYTNLPLHGLSRPTDEQVRTALTLIETLPGPVFIHCQHGCDRTGTIVACYRIKHDRWSHETALQEAARYGMSWLERGMKNFVIDFSKASARLAKN